MLASRQRTITSAEQFVVAVISTLMPSRHCDRARTRRPNVALEPGLRHNRRPVPMSTFQANARHPITIRATSPRRSHVALYRCHRHSRSPCQARHVQAHVPEWGNAHLRHGALYYSDSISDDAQPGKVTSFPQAVQLKEGEVIALAWVVYRNKEDRDRIRQGGHGGSATQGVDGPLEDAFRWQAHVLGWLRDHSPSSRPVTEAACGSGARAVAHLRCGPTGRSGSRRPPCLP